MASSRTRTPERRTRTHRLPSGGKHFVVSEPEFASVLTVSRREGSILSSVLRQLWDDGSARTMKVKNAVHVEGAHVSVIGHITTTELTAKLDVTEKANGFANRFLIVCARRSQELPFGGAEVNLAPVAQQLRLVRAWANRARKLNFDDSSADLWEERYPELSRERPGLGGAVVSRAEAQVLRLAVLYAALDRSEVIKLSHLKAALEVWRYCEDSARYVFGDTTGDEDADKLLKALRERGPMSATDRNGLYGRGPSTRANRASALLIELGLAVETEEKGKRGAPTKRLEAIGGKTSPWPKPLGKAAFHGVAGRFIRLIEPETEADPAALLIQFLVAAGNFIGSRVYVQVGPDRHGTALFALIVGSTGKARKGVSLSHIKELFRHANAEWVRETFINGLQSGEGLIQHLGGRREGDE